MATLRIRNVSIAFRQVLFLNSTRLERGKQNEQKSMTMIE